MMQPIARRLQHILRGDKIHGLEVPVEGVAEQHDVAPVADDILRPRDSPYLAPCLPPARQAPPTAS